MATPHPTGGSCMPRSTGARSITARSSMRCARSRARRRCRCRRASTLVADPELKDRFERWWGTSSMPALDRLKLYKLVWDLIGSEFAGRHMLYERFYAGNSIIVRNQSDREAPWETFHATVDGLLERVQTPKSSG